MRVVHAAGPLSESLPSNGLLARARALRDRYPALKPVKVMIAEELSRRVGARVLLAAESLQTTGSFKVRGALLAVEALASRSKRVIAASAGNHGAGVAFACAALGVRATIVVPRSSPAAKLDKMRASGAEVIVREQGGYDEAEAYAKSLAEREGAPFVSGYDDLFVLAGNGGSLAFDVVTELPDPPRYALVPFGGGGLATGFACGLASAFAEPLGEVRRVWGVQSEASCAMARSLERGSAIEALACDGDTFAEGLEGGITTRAFERAAGVVAGVIVVDESAIARAMVYANDVLGLRIEGSAAAALAPLLEELPLPLDAKDTVLVVLTGRNVDDARFDQARRLAET